MDKSIFKAESIQKLEISDDEVLVVKVSNITYRVMTNMRNNLCKILGENVKVVIVDNTVESMTVLSKKKLLEDLAT